ncbi:MAG: 16S rRNA (adenine(1518)-N(6)/adenine(1519)-N(6))-dimethyltransferase RsmA [Ruminococcaceae bacterium]|nr:16S rRNA (adenine(1518)-N(6)/adenine(1519)-N(6))-dimethyltransferase RsmA [Oscillospiraceae bacterium]
MKLTSLSEVKNIMEKHGLRFNKGYGQNFLINEAVPRRIAEECGASEESAILEIGPGIGTLSQELCKLYKKVVAVEIDTTLIPALGETMAEFDNFKVINADILKVDLPALIKEEFGDMPLTVCANLPYYITTPIIMGLLESGCRFDNITVMIQKEVALRLCAKPGDSDYGSVTASVARYGKASRLFNVSAGSFVPAPKVDSAVIRIEVDKERKYSVKDEKTMTRVIRGAFAQRRKTLVNSFSSEFSELSKEELTEAVVSVSFTPDIRGEKLGITEFALIADAVYDKIQIKKGK